SAAREQVDDRGGALRRTARRRADRRSIDAQELRRRLRHEPQPKKLDRRRESPLPCERGEVEPGFRGDRKFGSHLRAERGVEGLHPASRQKRVVGGRVLDEEGAEADERLGRTAEVEQRPPLPVERARPLPPFALELEEGEQGLRQPSLLALQPEELEECLGAEIAARIALDEAVQKLPGTIQLALPARNLRGLEERIVRVGMVRKFPGEA